MIPRLPAALSIALIALGGISPVPHAKAADGEPHSVTVAMKEYEFLPSHLIFRHGQTYRLHLVNLGKELHEFTAAKFFQSVEAKNPEILANGGGEIVLQPHEAKDFDFVAKKTGHFALTCADHDWIGMVGDIAVE